MDPRVATNAHLLPTPARLVLLAGAALLASCGHLAAQAIPSALPAIGKPLDIRDTRNITAPDGQVVVTASHIYQVATKAFDSDGRRRDLPLDQTVRLQSLPVLATYGLTSRWNVGAGASLVNSIERKQSVLNFVPGATLLEQALPVGSVSTIESSGDGVGDLNLVAQYRPGWFSGDRVESLLAVDVVAPTAGSTPGGPLDLALGQGYWTYRLSYSAVKEIFPITYFARAGYEWNRPDTLSTATGGTFRLDAGDGVNYAAGASYSIGARFSLQALAVGSWHEETVRSNVPARGPATRSLDFRPGYTFRLGSLQLTQQLAIPLAGANTLAPEGILTTVEYRF
ncbi:MAG: hypothetical protein HY816_13635 [Candidatus Wallbacteria bacterium]|nr:hypothetical protein [Candidatus Wallbacteria bacterium]